jgi:hypothetical protein
MKKYDFLRFIRPSECTGLFLSLRPAFPVLINKIENHGLGKKSRREKRPLRVIAAKSL